MQIIKHLKNAVSLVSIIAAIPVAHAALQDRDLDKNGVTDAFYDTTLNITWLRNANVNGEMSWAAATNWASNFVFGGYSDWRLPEMHGDCTGYSCTSSEMGHLWYMDLGNVPDSYKAGSFLGMQQYGYWTGSALTGFKDWWGNDFAWQYLTNGGYQRSFYADTPMFALAVRDGDVTAAPEPESYLMLLAGLGLVAGISHRRKLEK